MARLCETAHWAVRHRAALRATREAREAHFAGRRARVAVLWNLMSIRDMASELDAPIAGIQNDARLLGLPPRAVSAQP